MAFKKLEKFKRSNRKEQNSKTRNGKLYSTYYLYLYYDDI